MSHGALVKITLVVLLILPQLSRAANTDEITVLSATLHREKTLIDVIDLSKCSLTNKSPSGNGFDFVTLDCTKTFEAATKAKSLNTSIVILGIQVPGHAPVVVRENYANPIVEIKTATLTSALDDKTRVGFFIAWNGSNNIRSSQTVVFKKSDLIVDRTAAFLEHRTGLIHRFVALFPLNVEVPHMSPSIEFKPFVESDDPNSDDGISRRWDLYPSEDETNHTLDNFYKDLNYSWRVLIQSDAIQ